jgi:alkanesulfonate monooxygenase SsuD/methylene tetrahydromethanopterin reductase-like flavin-dependent oxidoreductase (luciferase family)
MRVGLALPVAEQPDRGGAALSYRELRGFALLAEDAGLDSIWLADHLFYQPPDEQIAWAADPITHRDSPAG